jgi:hypothetical protein
MTDKKITDEEIIRNYEWCIGCTSDRCRECTMDEEGFCEEELQDLVLDLINRQKAEIDKLKGSTIVSNIMESQRIKREAKAEAYKEFAEKLKEKLGYYHTISDGEYCGFDCGDIHECIFDCGDIHECIDNLLKEMVGEEE